MNILPLSKDPQPDKAEFNAFFPSKFALGQFTSPNSDLEGADYPQPYQGTRRNLVIGTNERYLKMENGTLFSTGNHPVETLVPMYHLHRAGFKFDIATVSGNAMKFESWGCLGRTRQSPACIRRIWSENSRRGSFAASGGARTP